MAEKKKKKLIPIRINRATWLVAQNLKLHKDALPVDVSGLLRRGMMCCLGFAVNQRYPTIPKTVLAKCSMPEDVGEKMGSDVEWRLFPKGIPGDLQSNWSAESSAGERRRSKLFNQAAKVNDDPALGKREREKKVREIFARLGWKAIFHGAYRETPKRIR